MLLQPADCRAGVPTAQVHHQVDGPAATFLAMPVEELGTRDRKRAVLGLPSRPVAAIPFGSPAH